MGIVHILEQHREELPEWLAQPVTEFDRRSFFLSRTVYYPGSGIDGQPVCLCGRAHAAHAFVYVDNSTTQQAISDRVNGRHGIPFDGYKVEYEQELEEADIWPGGVPEQHGDWVGWRGHVEITRYVLFVVLKREDVMTTLMVPSGTRFCSLATTALRDTTLFIVRMMGRRRHSSWSLRIRVLGEMGLAPTEFSRESLSNAMCFQNGYWLGTPNLGSITTIREPTRSVTA